MKKVLITGLLVLIIIAVMQADIQDLSGNAKKNLRSADNYYRQKIYEKALPFYEQVIEENPYHIESLFIISGINYEIKKDYWTAYDYYTRTLEAIQMVYDEYAQLEASDEKAAKKYAKKYIEKEKLEDKREMATTLLSNCWTYLYKKGYNHYTAEEYDLALAELEKLLQLAPDSVLTLKLIGNSYLKLDNIEAAISSYKSVYEMEPNNKQNAQLIANQYFQLDQKDNAVIWYQKASEIAPEDPDNYFNMGICYTNLEQPAEAMAMFNKTLEYEPSNIDAIYNAKVIALQLKDMDSFLKFSGMEFAVTGYTPESLKVFCYQLNSLELYDAVLEYGEKWAELDPEDPAPYQLMFLAANKLDKKDLKEKYQKKIQKLK
ncbi:MAG: tetratricopeptide repeat protein [Candidatus Cloacimonetes bacterium]|nr:tetratricopeptide repeat protein [Candidatus Cloacimonadota bacterium]